MIKCPNCGSTAQIKLVESYHYNTNHIAEEYECGCGAKLIRHYKCQVGILYTDEGVKYIREEE
jgi:hypothetical protein